MCALVECCTAPSKQDVTIGLLSDGRVNGRERERERETALVVRAQPHRSNSAQQEADCMQRVGEAISFSMTLPGRYHRGTANTGKDKTGQRAVAHCLMGGDRRAWKGESEGGTNPTKQF